MSGASASETWLREAVARVVAELTLFGRTFAAFLLHPGRSARDWQIGADSFMNPLHVDLAGGLGFGFRG